MGRTSARNYVSRGHRGAIKLITVAELTSRYIQKRGNRRNANRLRSRSDKWLWKLLSLARDSNPIYDCRRIEVHKSAFKSARNVHLSHLRWCNENRNLGPDRNWHEQTFDYYFHHVCRICMVYTIYYIHTYMRNAGAQSCRAEAYYEWTSARVLCRLTEVGSNSDLRTVPISSPAFVIWFHARDWICRYFYLPSWNSEVLR